MLLVASHNKENALMKKVAWITDSTSGLPVEYLKEKNIHVVPLQVIINDKSYREDVDITKEEFYDMLKDYGDGAKTSQPAIGEFIELYEKLKEEYDSGIALHASSALTGTYQSSLSASETTGFPVEVIDSKIGSYALGEMIRRGIQMEENGKPREEIVDTLRTYPDKAEMYLLPANFEQLKRSGRVSAAQSAFASLMKINLLLRFENGKVIIGEKVRTQVKAKRRLFQIIEEAIEKHQLEEVCIMHAGVKEEALMWKEELEKKQKQAKIKIEALVPVAGVHTGYGTMAVAWLKK